MSETLAEVRDALLRVAAVFDASRLPMPDAHRLLDTATTITRVGHTLVAALSARVADSGTWREHGAKSPAHHLARETGTTISHAQQLVDTGRRLDQLPQVADAAKAGRLSPQQAAEVTAAATADPSAAAHLLDVAQTRSLGELRDECAKVRATQEDPETRRARIHDTRYLRRRRDPDGATLVELRDNPETIAELIALITPERDRLFTAARKAGRRERPDALDLDALMATLRNTTGTGAGGAGDGGGGGGARRAAGAKILVRVDLDTLLRGYPTTGETCEIVGYGPVAVTAITDMINTGNPFLAAIATRGHQVLGVAHLRRHPTTHQDTALHWSDPTCAVTGCNTALRLERDHRIPWHQNKITLYDTLDRLCTHHHRLKTTQDWALTDGHGKRAFVPPSDPRHPDHNPNAPPGAA